MNFFKRFHARRAGAFSLYIFSRFTYNNAKRTDTPSADHGAGRTADGPEKQYNGKINE